MKRYEALTTDVWRRLESVHGDPEVIEGAWYRGLPPQQIVENVLKAANHQGAVEMFERIGRLARNEHVGATSALRQIANLADETRTVLDASPPQGGSRT